MSSLHPDGASKPSAIPDDVANFHSLKQSLSASSFFHNSRKDRSNSPQKSRSKSPGTSLRKVESQDEAGRASGHNHVGPLNIDIPKMPQAAEAAFTALKYLPTPLLVLSSLKTVMLANEAMGRLLGLESSDKVDGEQEDGENTTDEDAPNVDMLRGQSLSQLGIDMVQDGQQIWVSWDKFLDSLADDLSYKQRHQHRVPDENASHRSGNGYLTPANEKISPDFAQTSKGHIKKAPPKRKSRALVHDIVVNVVISSQYIESGNISSDKSTKSSSSDAHIAAKMTVSVWALENQRFFNLTFTSPYGTNIASPKYTHSRTSSRAQNLSPSTRSNPSSPGSPAFCSQCGSLPSPAITSPTSAPSSLSPFPPMGPPGKADASAAPAIMHKLSRMKDAIINTMDIPLIAMWRDESISIPNKAAAKLMHMKCDPTDDEAYDTLSRFKLYDEKFEKALDHEELPIVRLCRSQQPFTGWKVGMIKGNGERSTWEASGEGIYDERTGEFLGGIVSLKDVTKYDDMIRTQSEENEQQFQLICETMPQMLWTTTPTGFHDWFSKRWYEYTGLTEKTSLGEGWQNPFHPDDMLETQKRWAHSLATGDEYSTEYRCKRYDGEWRWMLGRATPLRDNKSGRIIKWFGSCTDIHDVIEARRMAKETRQRLLNVIKHAKTAVWAVDTNRNLNFMEGRLLWEDEKYDEEAKHDVGKNIYEVMGKHKKDNAGHHQALYKNAIEKILGGERREQDVENYIEHRKCWCRTRFIPVMGEEIDGANVEKDKITGVIGISIDVTEMKERDHEIEKQKKESLRLSAAESAAKEASKLKSQFLANMSHEIRTPIAGVIGMSELILDTKLDEEQKECAENIQRSANALLTVINDILDLSKVESGRLDIEEVQFSLGVVIKDVCKMLSFAAERKNLDFQADVQISQEHDLVVLGDPGRIRQILTNLLTNSIKFTSEGYVRIAVMKKREDSDTVSVVFTVEDTGIGIEEDVKHRLFKPFSQADSSTARRFGGTGLGLTICKNLVELMHGKIRLDSELGHGTKATFWIPFNKLQFTGRRSAAVNVDLVPPRLQSEHSISGCPSEIRSRSATPPMSPIIDSCGLVTGHKRGQLGSSNLVSPLTSSEEALPLVDRSKVHVLVVEDNAINQQIALKTVKKFGFSVNAVWNGKEALDYLLAESSPTHPKPDIILMDVQMPILDGYRATHLIRHHSPYSSIADIRNLPIIAMTASAIQGDKEKCQKAGMDDYLAKPVKGKALENMLLKWATDSNRKSRPPLQPHSTDRDSNCTDPDSAPKAVPLNRTTSPSAPENKPSEDTTKNNDHKPLPQATPNRTITTAALPVPDTGDDHATAAEMATALRDDKLLAASESNPYTRHMSMSPPPSIPTPSQAAAPPARLTAENIGRLDQQQQVPFQPWGLLKPRHAGRARDRAGAEGGGVEEEGERGGGSHAHSRSHDSLVVEGRDSSEMERENTVGQLVEVGGGLGMSRGSVERGVRGWLSRKESDRSQVTVRPDDFVRRESVGGGGGGKGGGDAVGGLGPGGKEKESAVDEVLDNIMDQVDERK